MEKRVSKRVIKSAANHFQMIATFGKMEKAHRVALERVMKVIKRFNLETGSQGMVIFSSPLDVKVKLASFGGMTGLLENIVLDRIDIGYDLMSYNKYQSFGLAVYLILASGNESLRFYIAKTENALVGMTSCDNKALKIYSDPDNYLQLSDKDGYSNILGFCTEVIAEVNKNLDGKNKLFTHLKQTRHGSGK